MKKDIILAVFLSNTVASIATNFFGPILAPYIYEKLKLGISTKNIAIEIFLFKKKEKLINNSKTKISILLILLYMNKYPLY